MSVLKSNPILATDSYKLSHPTVYPEGTDGMYAYIEPRTNGKDTVMLFGLQMWLIKFVENPATLDDIYEAEEFAAAHGEPFYRAGWERIVHLHRGIPPIKICAVPEGMPLASGLPLVTIESEDPELAWVVPGIETTLQRGVWYPSTVASMDYAIKRDIAQFYRISGADMSLLPFSLHDFGGRGVTSAEQAEIGGAAHLVNFMGSDTIEGVRAANFYYNSPMAAFSVPATEHSIECAYGGSDEQEEEYLRTVLTKLAKPGGIVSIVIDGYDTFRAAEKLCGPLKELILQSKAKVVFRPDSGDMMEVVPRLLQMQAAAFGTALTSKGYRKINTVGIIQGDGVDHMQIKSLLGKVLAMGFSADNVVFGSGGSLLQKVNRDTFRFAQKVSAIGKNMQVVGAHGGTYQMKWSPVNKNPATDRTKASKPGRVRTARSKVTGGFIWYDMDKPLDVEYEDVMRTVFARGKLIDLETLDQIRARCIV